MNADELDRWDRHEAEARGRAMAAMRDDMSGDELVDVMRTLADELREIPPRVRAIEAATAAAEDLVSVLVAAGVEFANPDNAPTQIAGSILAAWMAADDGGSNATPDTVAWLDIAGCLADAVAWTLDNGDVSDPATRRTMARLAEAHT
jgi:hypothetical protein